MSNEESSMGNPQDVLVHAPVTDVIHKHPTNLSSDEEAYWRVNGTPRQTETGRRIWFEYQDSIHAWGEITALEDGRIWFDAAHETYVPCLDNAPTRGFTYIDPLLPRLEEVDWSVSSTGEFVIPDGGRAESSVGNHHPEDQRPRMDVEVVDASVSATAEAVTAPIVGKDYDQRKGEITARIRVTVECPCGTEVTVVTVQPSGTCRECGRRWELK